MPRGLGSGAREWLEERVSEAQAEAARSRFNKEKAEELLQVWRAGLGSGFRCRV